MFLCHSLVWILQWSSGNSKKVKANERFLAIWHRLVLEKYLLWSKPVHSIILILAHFLTYCRHIGATLDSFLTTGAEFVLQFQEPPGPRFCMKRLEAQQETSKVNTVSYKVFENAFFKATSCQWHLLHFVSLLHSRIILALITSLQKEKWTFVFAL